MRRRKFRGRVLRLPLLLPFSVPLAWPPLTSCTTKEPMGPGRLWSAASMKHALAPTMGEQHHRPLGRGA